MEEEKVMENEVKEVTVKTSNIDIKASGKSGLNAIKNIFFKPVDAIKDFVADNNFIAGIIMIVVAALSTGIYKLATLKSAYDKLDNSWFKAPKPEYLKEFFTTFGTNLLEYALVALIGYLIISKLMKGSATLKQVVSAVGISLSLVIIAYLVNSILVFIDKEVIIYIISYLRTFATIYSYMILYQAVKEVGGIDKNKVFLSIASMSVCATVVMDILNKIFE